MKWEPKPRKNAPPEKNIWVCGQWSISKVWGYHEKAYVYELRYEDGSYVGARFGTFRTGAEARDEAAHWELYGEGIPR